MFLGEGLADYMSSGQSSITAKETIRTFPRTNEFANHDARARNLQHRNRKYQQGDAGRYEERRHSHEADSRGLDYRQGG